MSFYEELVMRSQVNYQRNYGTYAMGKTVVPLSKKPQPSYREEIAAFAEAVRDAECIIVGGASGLSAAGGGDFYYSPTESFYKHFGKFAERYGFQGAFEGSFYHYQRPEEKWAFLSTFLDTTLNAEIRKPYADLVEILRGKDYFIITTNQDTQAIKAFPEDRVAEIQGDHRFFQCSNCCSDDTWDAVEPVKAMIKAQGNNTSIPSDLIPRCPHCGAEAFPWVRGYGNFLQGTRYRNEYKKISDYILSHKDKRVLFLELGVGRMTPMFIQEPFWELTEILENAAYISVNDTYAYLPQLIEDKGLTIKGDILTVLDDVLESLRGKEEK